MMAAVDLLKENKITRVKLFDTDLGSFRALTGSGSQVMVGMPNEMLTILSSFLAACDSCVRQNVSTYVVKGGVNISFRVGSRLMWLLSCWEPSHVATVLMYLAIRKETVHLLPSSLHRDGSNTGSQ